MDLKVGYTSGELAVLRGHFHPALLIFVDWPGDPAYIHSGTGDLSWNGQTWQGLGEAGRVEVPEMGPGMAGAPVVISVVGLPADIVTRQADIARNMRVEVYTACTTTRGGTVLTVQPRSAAVGRTDSDRLFVQRQDDGTSVYGLEIEAVSGGDLRAGAAITHSYEDQITRHPGDTAGRHFINAQAALENLTWPAT